MTSPTITPSLLASLGTTATAPAGVLAALQARDNLPGAFARELQKLQPVAPTVCPPPPLQAANLTPMQPSVLPPAKPMTTQPGATNAGSNSGTSTASSGSAGSSGNTGTSGPSSGSTSSTTGSPANGTGNDHKPTTATDSRPPDSPTGRNGTRSRTTGSRNDGTPHPRSTSGDNTGRTTARSDDNGDDRRALHDRARRLHRQDAEAAGTVPAQQAPAVPLADPPLPTRAELGGADNDAFVGPQADTTTAAAGDRGIPQVPGFDLLQGRAGPAGDAGTDAATAASLAGAATPSAPALAAMAGDTMPSLRAAGIPGAAGTEARATGGRATAGLQAATVASLAGAATPLAPGRTAMAGDTVVSLRAAGAAGAAGAEGLAAGGQATAELQAVIANRQDDALAVAIGPQPTSGLPSFAAELARASGAGPASASAAANAAPTELTLPTPVTAPEFLPRLGGELAVLARDGVQEARINVHPVELGPISVQIALDGATAQVHLSVDNAQTRELLEQAMPTLAAALRDTGLTLTGGGVFQQSRQAPQDQAAPDSRNTAGGRPGRDDGVGDADLARMAAATPRRLRPLGALDVFA